MRNKFTTTFLVATVTLACSPVAASTPEDKYTFGPLYGPSQGLVQNYWIQTNMPGVCDWAIKEAATKWTNANLRFNFVYKGLVSPQSWSWDSFKADNISTTANTIDTSVEAGRTDSSGAAAQVEYRVRSKTGDPTKYAVTDRYVFSDADVVVDYGRISSGTDVVCSTSGPSSTQYDFATVILHEFGHVLGMDRDLAPGASTTVVANPLLSGQVKRTLTDRDVERAVYLYGAP